MYKFKIEDDKITEEKSKNKISSVIFCFKHLFNVFTSKTILLLVCKCDG